MMKNYLRFDHWLGSVLTCFVLLSWANWGRLENPIVDIGREVEISARLLDGQVLYRDVATYYTPLGYYGNALALSIFGRHLEVLYLVNLLLALTTTILFYGLAKRLMNSSWATLSTVCMLIYCAIGPGPFNFIIPYSSGAIYAITFSMLALTFFHYYTDSMRSIWLVAGAMCCGLAGLAKQEYGVAILAGLLIGVNIHISQVSTYKGTKALVDRARQNLILIFVAGACVIFPLMLMLMQVSQTQMLSSLFPASQISAINRDTISLGKTLNAWITSFTVFVVSLSVIFASLSLARKISNLQWLKVQSKLQILVGAILTITFSLFSLYCLNLSAIFGNYSYYPPKAVFNALGNLSWSIPLLVGWFAFTRKQIYQSKQASLMWALLVFSLVLNSRWGFYINFYGLYAVPVVILFFTMLYKVSQRFHKEVWLCLLVCLLIAGALKFGGYVLGYPYTVNANYGNFHIKSDTLASALNNTIKAIEISKANSVLVIPEGNILNFLTATHSPSRELTFLPHVLPNTAAEKIFIERMQAHPPEMIVYVPRSFSEWGYKNYADFNPLIDKWITKEHQLNYNFPTENSSIRVFAGTKS